MKLHHVSILMSALLCGLTTCEVSASTTETTKIQLGLVTPAVDDAKASVVAMDGDTMVVGTPYATSSGKLQGGRAFVYLRTGSSWAFEAELSPVDASEEFDQFGMSVAVSGDTAVVGAGHKDNDRGAAYVFVRTGTSWTRKAKLTASDALEGDGFGTAVAISGDTAVVGAGGAEASYVFIRASETWPQQQILPGTGVAGFGCAVAVSGLNALIGAPGATSGGQTAAGASYVFNSTDSNWTSAPLKATLTAASPETKAYFGYAVDLSGQVALIGAPGATDNGKAGAGRGYVSTNLSSSSALSQMAAGGAAGDHLGLTANLGGEQADIALLGAPGAASTNGAAYLFTRGSGGNASTWIASPSNPLTASDGIASDALGRGVALFGDTAVAVSPGAKDAYVYQFDCGFGRYWPRGVWLFPGLPCKPTVATVAGQFGDDLISSKYGYNNRWYMYDWNETTQLLVGLSIGSPAIQGGGYELKTLDGGRVDFDGTITDNLACNYGDSVCYFEIPLPLSNGSASSVALVGHPFPYPVDWADVRFSYSGYNGGQLLTPSQAQSNNIANKSFRRYNGTANETYDDSTPGMSGNLFPNESVWVWVKSSATSGTIKLLIPAKPSRQNAAVQPNEPKRFALIEGLLTWLIPAAEAAPKDDPSVAARDARRKQHKDSIGRGEEWYVRLIVETADGLYKDPANVLGQLTDAAAGYDNYDVNELEESPALPDGPVLYLVFPHPEWNKGAGHYSSDYHRLNKNADDRWSFEVHGNQSGPLRLRWEATNPEVLARGRLVDEETGEVIDPAVDDQYEFALTGPSRTFRWDYLATKGKPANSK